MNILFTNFCNRNCPYCFARGKLVSGRKLKTSYINLDDLKVVIDFMKRAEMTNVGVIGGEPTLHPQFEEAVSILVEEGLYVRIFSNGLITKESTLQFLKEINKNKWFMTLNVNSPEDYSKKEWSVATRTMEILKDRVKLGFNIYKLDFDADFLIGLVEKYNLKKAIRLGVANPLFSQDNEYIRLEDHKKLTPRIIGLARKCCESDISLEFDCGFTLCSFSKEEISQLHSCNSKFGAWCGRGPDVGPDLTVWNCFATSVILNRKITDFDNPDEVYRFYAKKFNAFRLAGGTNKCANCEHLISGQCGGGCLGHTLKSFNLEDKTSLTSLR